MRGLCRDAGERWGKRDRVSVIISRRLLGLGMTPLGDRASRFLEHLRLIDSLLR
jgi:hypothetical protein